MAVVTLGGLHDGVCIEGVGGVWWPLDCISNHTSGVVCREYQTTKFSDLIKSLRMPACRLM